MSKQKLADQLGCVPLSPLTAPSPPEKNEADTDSFFRASHQTHVVLLPRIHEI